MSYPDDRERDRDDDPLFESLRDRDDPYTAERDYKPIHPEPAWRALARKLSAPLIALGLLIWKAKFVLVAIFKFKIFTVAGSMLVSIAAYAWLWGWKFAIGFVLLLLIHELGHVLELRRQGIPASAPMFIPFLGAYVAMKQMPANAWKEAQVALAGPVLGTAGAAVVWAVGEARDSEFLVALAFVGFFLNLFNLVPVSPLDGGRAVAAIHPGIWLLGFVGLLGLVFVWPNPILILILIVGGIEVWGRWRARNLPQNRRYYEVKPWQRVAVGVVYIGLAIALITAMNFSHIDKEF